jgi:hypothetical protein
MSGTHRDLMIFPNNWVGVRGRLVSHRLPETARYSAYGYSRTLCGHIVRLADVTRENEDSRCKVCQRVTR